MIVREVDCMTEEGLTITRHVRSDEFGERIVGRFAAEDIKSEKGEVLVARNDIVDEDKRDEIVSGGVEEVVVRSPLTCEARYGVCQKCYGWSMGDKKVSGIGLPVGVIAAQSIGEPGTQLTMRTKHSGGIIGVDVTQGLPRVEELFEARIPKTLSPLAEIPGKVSVEELTDGWKVKIVDTKGRDPEEREYIIPITSKLMVEDGQLIEAGAQLANGFLDIKEILTIRGLRAAQEYLVSELQSVYESQGISINDRHFEVIVRKMSDKVKVTSTGDTDLLPGEQVDRSAFEEANEAVLAAGGEPATARQVVLGITRRAVQTESWLSAASFQQTTSVIAQAALAGKRDRLLGLKENVIIGRLVPVREDLAQLEA